MGQVETTLHVQNHTSKQMTLNFRSMDKFDFCNDLYHFQVLEGRLLQPHEEKSTRLKINANATGCMFTMDTVIGYDRVTIRLDQKISLMDKHCTRIDVKNNTFAAMMHLNAICGNGTYGCFGAVMNYDITVRVGENKSLVLTIADKHCGHQHQHHQGGCGPWCGNHHQGPQPC